MHASLMGREIGGGIRHLACTFSCSDGANQSPTAPDAGRSPRIAGYMAPRLRSTTHNLIVLLHRGVAIGIITEGAPAAAVGMTPILAISLLACGPHRDPMADARVKTARRRSEISRMSARLSNGPADDVEAGFELRLVADRLLEPGIPVHTTLTRLAVDTHLIQSHCNKRCRPRRFPMCSDSSEISRCVPSSLRDGDQVVAVHARPEQRHGGRHPERGQWGALRYRRRKLLRNHVRDGRKVCILRMAGHAEEGTPWRLVLLIMLR